MKTWTFSICLLLFAFFHTSCLKDQCTETRTFVRLDPVYRSQQQLDIPISLEKPRNLEDPGIIYYYNNYILINEYLEGIHIINNQNPENPVNEAFLSIEGNEHFAILDNQLQANKYNSLLTIDISDLKNPKETSRVRNAFQEIWNDPQRGFLVAYRQTSETREIDCSSPDFNSLRWNDLQTGGVFFLRGTLPDRAQFAAVSDQAATGGGVGIGGSTARFTILKDHLYAVTSYEMKVFDLDNPRLPALKNTINLGWGIETIYPFQDRLFIGSNSGMFIYDVSDPANPLFQSSFEHARACDPVVADDETAFVTLRDGSMCEGFDNQLDVIDVSNVLAPRQIRSYKMLNPHGLALDGDILYICEGQYGFKIFDVSDRGEIRELGYDKNLKSTDVIALPGKILLVVGKEGLKQFDAQNPSKLRFLSEIPVVKGA